MKFGKQIQAQQVPGWSSYYLDYKFLKKIISSLAANRPASEAAALALGVRPHDTLIQLSPQPISQTIRPSPAASPAGSPGQPPFFAASGHDLERGPDFRAHKAAFFFKLERELEKINAFYLQKEAEVTLRMETLLSKRRAAAMRGIPDTSGNITASHVEWSAVEEGFRLLERDLGKLQLISELADTVATCLLNITDLSSGLKFEGPGASDIFAQQILTEITPPTGPFRDLESNFHKALAANDAAALIDCVHYSDLLAQQSGGLGNVTRILWNIIIEAPPDLTDLILATLTSPFDFQFIDDINGRTCLHEAAIAGAQRMVSLCIENNVPVDKCDVYGRTALHYAAMRGHAHVCDQLLDASASPNILDRDNYSPLVYATLKGDVGCVRVLFEKGHVQAQPPMPSGDFSPLSLAAQAGHVDVVVLLLEHGATSMPNSNGEYPIHLAARQGHDAICRLLLHLDGWDTPDKYHEWTPLFHAARYGHAECVQILVSGNCRVSLKDELGHYASHYAAWYGHQSCLEILLSVTKDTPNLTQFPVGHSRSPWSDGGSVGDFEIDQIPSLSLPPPIMPHRVYGHNYLVNSHFVQVSIGRSTNKTNGSSGVRLHHRLISPFFKDEYLLSTTPLKLVMTAGPHVNSAPYTISLPQNSDEGSFSFQIASLDHLALEFSVYPNFGTKTIGRAVALPGMFQDIKNNQFFTLPIVDNRLHVIGEVDFEINIITPFKGVTLEVGGDLETYWKSTAVAAGNLLAPLRTPRRPNHIGSVHASPVYNASNATSQTLAISSLQGNYLYIVIQVTRDHHPVVFFDWLLPGINFELGVADVTLAQFEALARSVGKDMDGIPPGTSIDWNKYLPPAMISLDKLLKLLSPTVNVLFDLAYPSEITTKSLNLHRLNLNEFVGSVLQTIFNVSDPLETQLPRRKIAFMSFSPDVCSALNWKQPNYPVFFGTVCGKNPIDNPSQTACGSGNDDKRVSSVGAAVEFAKANNLLGIFVETQLLNKR
ncbi:Ankyrin repeat protein nuc-2 [Psilocybe cubensis]|uniref:Ankyrin repeat protein nuc-2 n=1 Tax=Psilocybe cubensis TaxID=181762 RepID=A0ACB8H5N9_PSICU|nr:Ankyrin repeat protein nuc-2 [Psilocybe cubensis]KAH9482952.1 Ankyrin repeat protein nuc-2 [Psilocybe cubensis]